MLIDGNGKIFTKETAINRLLFPVRTGTFSISDEAKKFIKTKLNGANADQLFQFIPKEMQALCQEKKLMPTKASVFQNQVDVSQSRSEASQTPHINSGDVYRKYKQYILINILRSSNSIFYIRMSLSSFF